MKDFDVLHNRNNNGGEGFHISLIWISISGEALDCMHGFCRLNLYLKPRLHEQPNLVSNPD